MREKTILTVVYPQETLNGKEKRIILYRNQVAETSKIELVTESDTEFCLQPVIEKVTFYKRKRKYGTVEVEFQSEKEAGKHSTVVLKTKEKISLLPIYIDKRNIRVQIERILPEIKPKWLVAAIMGAIKQDTKLRYVGI